MKFNILILAIVAGILLFGCAGVQIPGIGGSQAASANASVNTSVKTETEASAPAPAHNVQSEQKTEAKVDIAVNKPVETPVQCFKEVDRQSVGLGTPIGTSSYPYCACIGYDGVVYSNLNKFPSTTRCTCTNTPQLSQYVQANQVCPGQTGSGQANLFYYDGTATVQTSSTVSSTAPSTSTSSTSASTGSSGGTSMTYQQLTASKSSWQCTFNRKTFSGQPLKNPTLSKLYFVGSSFPQFYKEEIDTRVRIETSGSVMNNFMSNCNADVITLMKGDRIDTANTYIGCDNGQKGFFRVSVGQGYTLTEMVYYKALLKQLVDLKSEQFSCAEWKEDVSKFNLLGTAVSVNSDPIYN